MTIVPRRGAVVSTGNEVDLTWLDFLDYLLDEANIRVVLAFVEEIRDVARLEQVAARAAQLRKPIVLAKMGIFLTLFIWVRATLPRLRYDQLMSLGWKILLPAATLNVLITAIAVTT